MGVRRRTNGDKFPPPLRGRVRVGGSPTSLPIAWKLPSLYVAIVTLVAVTSAVLSDAPRWPFKPAPLSPQQTDVMPFDPAPSADATPSPTATSAPPSGRWMLQDNAISASLVGVSCADASHCVAVGGAGTILSTADAGNSWNMGHSGTSHPLVGVSCPGPAVCYAVTNFGELLKTGDAGMTWSISSLKNPTPFAIACPTIADCVTADGFETHDGGGSWQQASRLGAVNVACPASSRCYAVRNQIGHGVILGKSSGGWTLQAVTPYFLNAVICTSVNTCVAAGGGESGTNILTTGDGRNWTVRQHQATQQTFFDVGCATADVCFVVDGTANVLATTNQGQTWAWQDTGLVGSLYAVSCPASDSCFAVGGGPASSGGGLIARYQAEMSR